ncbi:MAG: YjiH family protein [Calditrichaeota bacterium]|nr:MAG: YjiH family protein [Calditrichota bacterium]
MEQDMLPFLFRKLVVPVGIIVPVGAVFLAFLVDYGLLEFVGVLMQPIMKPVWKTPGRSAVDAMASFVGSYSIGLLITNRVFKEGKYTVKEAAIIATGFSTVSATFMVIVAKTTGLMQMWNLYFWSTLAVTFLVTAVSVRIYPLKNKGEETVSGTSDRKAGPNPPTFANALAQALNAVQAAPGLRQAVTANLKEGFLMAMSILPSIMSVGLLGLLLAKYTVLFDIVGYLFLPITKLFGLPDAALAAKATALEVAEMFLPALLVVKASLATRYVIAVVSVSSILFFSASIPCILATEIPLTIPEISLIWLERALLSLILALLAAQIIF